jgi:glycerol-3-phosphate acyltransferase PlsY
VLVQPPFLPVIGLTALAYLLGSIPWGLVLTRLFTSVDLRRQGSGNIGATNVRRLAGTPLGLAALAGDALKGAVPVHLASKVDGLDPCLDAVFLSVVALAAFGGHLFPLFLRFRGGGKGVATAAGCFLAISPVAVMVALLAFILLVWAFRRVSVGSLTAAVVLPIALWCSCASNVFVFCAAIMTVMIFLRHKDNLRRLLAGTEPTIASRQQRHGKK